MAIKTPQALREDLINNAQLLLEKGLCVGTSGNLSVRYKHGMLITPSGISYENLLAKQLVFVDAQGQYDAMANEMPSSEYLMHHYIYQKCTHVDAIVHTHSVYCTALACMSLSIPAFHYMVAIAGGHDVPCIPYSLFGTQALAEAASQALLSRSACLLAHHGAIATGNNITDAFQLALQLENLAEIYHQCLQLGKVPLLTEQQMNEVIQQFSDKKYQQKF